MHPGVQKGRKPGPAAKLDPIPEDDNSDGEDIFDWVGGNEVIKYAPGEYQRRPKDSEKRFKEGK